MRIAGMQHVYSHIIDNLCANDQGVEEVQGRKRKELWYASIVSYVACYEQVNLLHEAILERSEKARER